MTKGNSKYGLPPSDFKHFVYRHIRIDKNEPFYVGIGSVSAGGLYNRAFSTKRNLVWHRITKKTDYRVQIIYESDDYKETLQKEVEFIKLYGRLDIANGTLCNLTDGGEGNVGYIASEETREKFRQRQFNIILTAENIKNRSLAQQNRYKVKGLSPKAKPVFQYDLNGIFLKKWSCPYHAGQFYKCGSKIHEALKKENHYMKNYFWFSEYKGLKTQVCKAVRLRRSISQIDADGNIINVFNNLLSASLAVCGNKTGSNEIPKVCRGERDSFMSFKWKYND